MNRFKIMMTLVAALIAVNGALLGLASQQPPIYPFPPLMIVIAVLMNAGLAVIQTQMPSWADSDRAARAIDRDLEREPPRV